MKKFSSLLLVMFFSFASIPSIAQRQINLPKFATKHIALQDPHTVSLNSYFINYLDGEQYCNNFYQSSIFIWNLDSRANGTDTLVLTDAGENFDTIYDALACQGYNVLFPARVTSLDYWIGHENNSGMEDTIVFYMEDTNPSTLQPNGIILWSDTVFTSVALSDGNFWMNVLQISTYPNVLVNGNYFAGVRYYGAAIDTFGILSAAYDYFSPQGSAEATLGRAYRKHAGQNNWRPDAFGQDYFYDQNANNIYDPGMYEAFPFQTFIAFATITDHSTAITGTVFKDLNHNGIFDAGEPPRANTIVEAGIYSASTDANGYFNLLVDTGNYFVQPVIQGYFTVSTSPVNVAANSYTQVYNAGNFATNDIPNVHDLRVDATRDICYVPGFGSWMNINYENFGTVTMSGTVKYVPDPIAGISWTIPNPTSTNADTLIWSFTNLLPGETRQIYLFDTIPATTVLGTPIHYYTEIQPISGDTIPVDNFQSVNDSVVGSFDPNDKTPFPIGIGPQGNISTTQKINYTIRFQNTGTYPAQTVIVRDTLDADFDISTFNFISSSFPCTWAINSERVVTFTFSNIMLADSNSNEPASHGFLKYSILPDTGLAPGTQLTNTGYIFFDYNTAVITNTTLNTIWTPNGTQEISFAGNNISIFPNPFTDEVSIKWDANNLDQPVQLLLFDVSGRRVREIAISGNQLVISREGLENGLYFFQLETKSGKNYAVGKIIAH